MRTASRRPARGTQGSPRKRKGVFDRQDNCHSCISQYRESDIWQLSQFVNAGLDSAVYSQFSTSLARPFLLGVALRSPKLSYVERFPLTVCARFHCPIAGTSREQRAGNKHRQTKEKKKCNQTVKEQRPHLNCVVTNQLKDPEVEKILPRVYPCTQFQRQTTFSNSYLLFTGTASTQACSPTVFCDEEDNLHLTIRSHIHRHLINILAHFSEPHNFLICALWRKARRKSSILEYFSSKGVWKNLDTK